MVTHNGICSGKAWTALLRNNWGKDTLSPLFIDTPLRWCSSVPTDAGCGSRNIAQDQDDYRRCNIYTTMLKRRVKLKEKGGSPEPGVWNAAFKGWQTSKCAVTWAGWSVAVCVYTLNCCFKPGCIDLYIESLWWLPWHWLADCDWWDIFCFPRCSGITDQ